MGANLTGRMVGLAGKLGSGKSSVGHRLADALNAPLASFGAYVRSIADERALVHSREVLQALGEELLRTLGPLTFASQVVDSSGWKGQGPLVVEGIRHVDIVSALREGNRETPFLLVYLEVPEELRLSRLEARDRLSPSQVAVYESHSTESDVVSRLRQIADLVVEAGADVDTTVAAVLSGLATIDT